MSDYQPIPCALHSRYELAILRQDPLIISGTDEAGNTHSQLHCRASDLITEAGNEYLKTCDRAGIERLFRLDRLTLLAP